MLRKQSTDFLYLSDIEASSFWYFTFVVVVVLYEWLYSCPSQFSCCVGNPIINEHKNFPWSIVLHQTPFKKMTFLRCSAKNLTFDQHFIIPSGPYLSLPRPGSAPGKCSSHVRWRPSRSNSRSSIWTCGCCRSGSCRGRQSRSLDTRVWAPYCEH